MQLPEPVPRFKRILLTGAAGRLGKVLRPRLKRHCEHLRLSDIETLEPAGAGEEIVAAALEDKAAVHELVEGVDLIVHMGGVAKEQPFDTILAGNIVGAYNLYEAARLHKIRRIVFASSHHVMGFYRQDEVVDAKAPMRPDGLYGLSKAFGENLARLYFDRYGIETVALRIGSSFPEPRDLRMLSTWLSHDDLERLVVASISAPVAGFTVIYGISDNHSAWSDNTSARHIGYRPQDSSEPFRAAIESRQGPLSETDLSDPAFIYQGGGFVKAGPF